MRGSTPHLRTASAEDVDGVRELAAAFTTSFELDRSAFEQSFHRLLVDSDCLIVVASVGDALVGYVLAFVHGTFFANGPVCWIEELMVRDDVRRAGIGRSLVADAEAWASSRGAGLVAMATRRAEEFWSEVGYESSATYRRKPIIPAASR
jgi:GNAT superfamily N-acetyltransferase